MPVKQIDVTAKQQKLIADLIKSGNYREEGEVLLAGIAVGLAMLENLQRKALQRKILHQEAQLKEIQRGMGLGTKLVGRKALKEHLDKLERQAIKLSAKRKVR